MSVAGLVNGVVFEAQEIYDGMSGERVVIDNKNFIHRSLKILSIIKANKVAL
jgi:hypothetical protein